MKEVEPGVYSILRDGIVYEARVDGDVVTIAGQPYKPEQADPRRAIRRAAGSSGAGNIQVKAPMPGKIVRVLVEVGENVSAGQGIAVIEAMKMQNELRSPGAGIVSSLSVATGDTVNAGAVLAVIE